MPREVRSNEQFQQLVPKALELRVVRNKESVKLKIRTPEYLYTFKTTEDEADDLIKGFKDIEVIEITRQSEDKAEKESKGKKSSKEDENTEEK